MEALRFNWPTIAAAPARLENVMIAQSIISAATIAPRIAPRHFRQRTGRVKSSPKKIYSASRHSFTARGVSITSVRMPRERSNPESRTQGAHQQRTDSSGFDAYSCRTIRPVHQSSPARSNPCFARCSLRATFFRDRHVSIFFHSYRKVGERNLPELSSCS